MLTLLNIVHITLKRCLLAYCLLWIVSQNLSAQTADSLIWQHHLMAFHDENVAIINKNNANLTITNDTLEPDIPNLTQPITHVKKQKRDWNTWKPDAKRALWLAIVIPGAGQIYNRKYWKLPIVYGGVVGCAYAMRWNDQMYRDYSQGYMDLVDSDPQSKSYEQFLHLGQTIDESNKARYTDLFKKRKDRYRRWRDLSFFSLIGVYALSIIDAYVDASLSQFDISDDLSLRVQPTILNNNMPQYAYKPNGIGVQCSLDF